MEARPFNFELRLELGLELEFDAGWEFEFESGLRCCYSRFGFRFRFKDEDEVEVEVEVEVGAVVGGCYDPSNPYEYEYEMLGKVGRVGRGMVRWIQDCGGLDFGSRSIQIDSDSSG